MDAPDETRHNLRDTYLAADEPLIARELSGEQPCPSQAEPDDTRDSQLPAGQIGDRQLEEEIAQLVFALAGRFRSRVGILLTQLDLTVPQAWLLLSLDQPRAMGEVANRVRSDPSTVTWLVDRLEARGLLTRCSQSSDRRVKRLVLTPEGERMREHLHAVFADVPGLAALSPVQLQTLHDLLRRAVGGCP